MKLSEFIKKYGDCEIIGDIEKCLAIPKLKYEPKYGEPYYYVGDNSYICSDKWVGHNNDIYRRCFLRIFKTQREAERYREIMRAFNEASIEPDWGDIDQCKILLYYDYKDKKVGLSCRYYAHYGAQFYFETFEQVRSLIERFGEKDIAKYVLGVEVDE